MIKPMNDNILVKEIFEEENNTSGIILVKKEESDIKKGTVVQLGAKALDTLKTNDVVYYNRFSAIPIKHNEEQYYIVNFYDVLAVEK